MSVSSTHDHRGQAEAGRRSVCILQFHVVERRSGGNHFLLQNERPVCTDGLLVLPAATLKHPIMWHNQIKGQGA